MLKIDLHGFTYAKVKDILPNWLITNYNNGVDDFEIVTGNSEQMKQIVKDVHPYAKSDLLLSTGKQIRDEGPKKVFSGNARQVSAAP